MSNIGGEWDMDDLAPGKVIAVKGSTSSDSAPSSSPGTYHHLAVVIASSYDRERREYNVTVVHRTNPPRRPGVNVYLDVLKFPLNGPIPRKVKDLVNYDLQQAVNRAINRINEGGYHPLSMNCEHFAYECCLGRSVSPQADRVPWAVALVVVIAAPLAGMGALASGVALGSGIAVAGVAGGAASGSVATSAVSKYISLKR